MNLTLWVAQALLALGFLYAGGVKVLTYDYYAAFVTRARSTPVSRPFAGLIGVAEMLGAVGIVLPMAINVCPAISAWAAVGLAAIMLLAIGYHIRGHEQAPGPIAFLLLAAFVAFGRLSGAS
jgi:uncharacterized membrane protein YphA (DoxX/SURF4 family)